MSVKPCAPEGGQEGPSIHASCIALGDTGVLVRGIPGSGKSALALMLMLDAPRCLPAGELVADDRVLLRRDDDGLHASAPPVLAGLLEVRGLGIRRFPFRASVRLTHVVDLGEEGPRMPLLGAVEINGLYLPHLMAADPGRAILMLAALLVSADHAG